MDRRTFLPVFLLGVLPAPVTRARDVMHVSTLIGDDPAADVSEEVLREAYRRLGRSLGVHQLPGERSLVYANEGRMDGELYRKAGEGESTTMHQVRLDRILNHGDLATNYAVAPGDVITIPERAF